MGDRERGRALLGEIAPEFLARPDVGLGRMFGSEGLSVRGKYFAVATHTGDLMVKLDRDRIGELGLENMVMRGRPMAEWAVVPVDAGPERWREVAEEAHQFVDSITPRSSSPQEA
jgi:hypothetical protein